MLEFLLWAFLIFVAMVVFFMIGEHQATRLPDDNRFKKWWRREIVGDDVYND